MKSYYNFVLGSNDTKKPMDKTLINFLNRENPFDLKYVLKSDEWKNIDDNAAIVIYNSNKIGLVTDDFGIEFKRGNRYVSMVVNKYGNIEKAKEFYDNLTSNKIYYGEPSFDNIVSRIRLSVPRIYSRYCIIN